MRGRLNRRFPQRRGVPVLRWAYEVFEFRGSFVPQFLQKRASAGLTVLQLTHVLSVVCRVSSGVEVNVRCANLDPVPPRKPQTGTARARNRTVSPPTLTGSFRALMITKTRPATTPTIIPFPTA